MDREKKETEIIVVGTSKAAFLLGLSTTRVRFLLKSDRIVGARKEGRIWIIPLKNGMPQITNCKKGPSGTWKKRVRKLPTIIHVDKPQIDKNRKNEITEPVITVKRGSGYNKKAHFVEIKGSCKIVYRPEKPLNCHAVVWIEVEPDLTSSPVKLLASF